MPWFGSANYGQWKAKASRRRAQRILYVIGQLDLGGTESHLVNVLPRLISYGWAPMVYCTSHEGVQAARLRAKGVPVLAPPLQGLRRMRPLRLGHAVFLGVTVVQLLWLMLWRRPVIAHFFLPAAYMIGGPLAIIARVPIRVMSRRSLNWYQQKRPKAARMERRLHAYMTAFFGNSKSVVQELQQEGCRKAQVRLLYNGIEINRFQVPALRSDLRRELDIAPDAFVFAMVGNLIPYKGHEDVLLALSHVAHALPQPWLLLCIGRDDGPLQRLQKLAAARHLAENVRFLGSRTDIAALLKAADVGLLASHEEGFSNALLEYMAAGLPVIATRVGGNPEAVQNGVTGLLVPPRAPECLGQALLRLALDRELAQRMAAAGRQRVEAQFSIEACVAAYDQLYRDLLNERKIRPTNPCGLADAK